MPWWISLIIELVKLLIPVLKNTAQAPKDERKEAAKEFGGEVKGLLSKLRARREGTVGESPDLVK